MPTSYNIFAIFLAVYLKTMGVFIVRFCTSESYECIILTAPKNRSLFEIAVASDRPPPPPTYGPTYRLTDRTDLLTDRTDGPTD